MIIPTITTYTARQQQQRQHRIHLLTPPLLFPAAQYCDLAPLMWNVGWLPE